MAPGFMRILSGDGQQVSPAVIAHLVTPQATETTAQNLRPVGPMTGRLAGAGCIALLGAR